MPGRPAFAPLFGAGASYFGLIAANQGALVGWAGLSTALAVIAAFFGGASVIVRVDQPRNRELRHHVLGLWSTIFGSVSWAIAGFADIVDPMMAPVIALMIAMQGVVHGFGIWPTTEGRSPPATPPASG